MKKSKGKILVIAIFAIISLSLLFFIALVLMDNGPIDDYINSNQQIITSDEKLSEGRKIYNLNQELEEENNTGANAETTSTQSTNSPNGVVTNEEYNKLSPEEKYDYIYSLCAQLSGGWDADGVRKILQTGSYKSNKRHNYTFLHFRDVIPMSIVCYFEYGIKASINAEHTTTEAGWTYKEGTEQKNMLLYATKHNGYYGCQYNAKMGSPWMTGSVITSAKNEAGSDKVTTSAWADFPHMVYSSLNWGWMWTHLSSYKKYHIENYNTWQDFGIVVYESGYGEDNGNGYRYTYQKNHLNTYNNYNLTKVDTLAETIKDQMNRQSASSSGNTSNNNYVTLGGTVIDSTKEWTPYSITEEWGYPLDPSKGYYSSKAGMRYHPVLHYNRIHSGMDYAAPKGIPVYVTKSGTVVQAGLQGERGNQVLVKHSGGWYTRYQHMTKITVKVGQTLNQGDQVGTVGNTGIGTGAHLHYEMLYGGYAQSNYKNPEKYYNLKLQGKMKLKDGTTFKDYMQCIKDYGHYGKVTFNKSSGDSTNNNTNTGNTNTSLAADYSSAIKQMRSLSGSGSNKDPRVSVSTPGYSWIQTYDVNLANVSDERLAVLAEGSKYLGTPYQNPKPNTPSEFCCSHFTSWCYRKALGYTLSEVPTYSGSQKNLSVAKEISLNEAKPGDLIWKPGHVMLFVKKLTTSDGKTRVVVMESTSQNYCNGKGTSVSSRPVLDSYKYFRLNKFKD